MDITEIKQLNPCRKGLEWLLKQTSLEQAWESCEWGDWLMWYLTRKGILTKEQSVQLAIKFSERVLLIYENKKPGDLRPRKAIASAQAWLDNPSEITRKDASYAAHAASYAAYAAAYPAYAAYAADAADAAAYAAYAAAYAADVAYAADAADAAADVAYAADAADAAAAYAADAADAYAADAARLIEQNEQAKIIRSIIKNPFIK